MLPCRNWKHHFIFQGSLCHVSRQSRWTSTICPDLLRFTVRSSTSEWRSVSSRDLRKPYPILESEISTALPHWRILPEPVPVPPYSASSCLNSLNPQLANSPVSCLPSLLGRSLWLLSLFFLPNATTVNSSHRWVRQESVSMTIGVISDSWIRWNNKASSPVLRTRGRDSGILSVFFFRQQAMHRQALQLLFGEPCYNVDVGPPRLGSNLSSTCDFG